MNDTPSQTTQFNIHGERTAPVAKTWQPIDTVPWDRYVLLCDKNAVRWDGNMEVGRWFCGATEYGCFWSPGGPNGGLEIGGHVSMGHYDDFTHWMDLPDDPE